MNLHDLTVAAGTIGGDAGRAVTALVRVAVAAAATRRDCASCKPGRRGEPCDCPADALDEAVDALEAVVGPIPSPAEPAP